MGRVINPQPSIFYFTIAVNKEGQEIKAFRPARIIKRRK